MNTEKYTHLKPLLEDLDVISTFKKWFTDSENKLEEFLCVISADDCTLSRFGNLSLDRRRVMLAECFPDRDPIQHRDISKYILNMYGLRFCKSCSKVKNVQDFRPNAGRYDGLNGQCRVCQSIKTKITQPSRQAKYKSAYLNRVMLWSSLESISEFYAKCPKGYHVDHIIPLQGDTVSGLHVLENLQYLTAFDNIQKHNKFIAG